MNGCRVAEQRDIGSALAWCEAGDSGRFDGPLSVSSRAAALASALVHGLTHEDDDANRAPAWLRRDEEFVNGVTHAAGTVLSLIGSLVLLRLAVERGTTVHVIGCATYAGSLVALYLASTLYHFAQQQPLKQILRVADHVCIFLMIAGTYTPVSLVPLRGPSGWALLALVWSVAAAGMIFKVTAGDWAYGLGSTTLYAATCALGLLVLPRILQTFPERGVACVLAGSLAYAVGLIFFLQDDRPYFHSIWHLFVLVGSACHYWAIVLAVIPPGA